jgi:DNA polymerase-3 subunit delta
MQLRADQLAGHLRDVQRLAPLYTVHGDELLLAQEAADAIRAAARAAGCAERQVFDIAGARFDWSSVLGAAQSASLFAEHRLVEIRIASGKPGKDGALALQRYAERLPPGVLTLVLLPRLDGQQQRSAWFAALAAAGVSVRADPVERRDLPRWLAQRLAAQGQRVADGEPGERALALLADRVEGHLLAAQQELAKLALLYPPGELSFEQIEQAVPDLARHAVAGFGEAVLAGQVARALRMLDNLRASGEAPVRVHWALAADLLALQQVQRARAGGQPLPLALREARVWGARERLFERALPQLGERTLARLVEAASVCDGVVKGLRHPGWPREPWAALRRLTLAVLQSLQPPGERRRLVLRPAGQ